MCDVALRVESIAQQWNLSVGWILDWTEMLEDNILKFEDRLDRSLVAVIVRNGKLAMKPIKGVKTK